MKREKQQVGKQGEDEACFHLKGLGHSIVARNWRNAHKEIDIVSLNGEGLHIVEVKSRTAPTAAEPETSVDLSKQRKLAAAARAFLHSDLCRSLGRPDMEVFFDIVTVVFDTDGTHIEYYQQAFIPTYV